MKQTQPKMSLYRTLFRRKGCIFIVLIASTFWIAYLIISSPAAKDQRFPSLEAIYESGFKKAPEGSVTRKVVTAAQGLQNPAPIQPQDVVIQAPEVVPKPAQVQPQDVVLHPPDIVKDAEHQGNVDQDFHQLPGGQKEEKVGDHVEKVEEKSLKEGDNSQPKKDNPEEKIAEENKGQADVKQNTPIVDKAVNKSLINETKPANVTKGPVLKDVGQQVIELSQKFKNKTIEVGENIKNKTIEKLADLGVIQKKKIIKLIFNKVRWNLNVSMADIAYILKDTEFLKKKQNITDMEYQPLSPSNSTGLVDFNFTSSKYGLGYCDCKDLTCMCCVRIQNKWLRVNNSACSQLNFVSKSQELQYEFRIDDKPIYKDTIAAEFPPKICMESDSAAAGACVSFSNVTSHVNIASDSHKIHLSGCMDLALTLFNKTLSDFPVGCFRIPGPGSEKEHENENNANFGNFVP